VVSIIRVDRRPYPEAFPNHAERQGGELEVVGEGEVGRAGCAATHLGSEQLGRTGCGQDPGLGGDRRRALEADLVDDERCEERSGVERIVLGGHLEGAEGHLTGPGRFDAGDRVGHVVADEEVVDGGRLHPGERQVVAGVEVDERPTEGAVGEFGECSDPFGEVWLRRIGDHRHRPQRRVDTCGERRVEESPKVRSGTGCPVRDEVTKDLAVRSVDVECVAVLLDSTHLCRPEWVSARFESDEQPVEPASAHRVGDRGGDLCRTEWLEGVEVEVSSAEQVSDHRVEHCELLVLRAVVHVDCSEQSGDDRLHVLLDDPEAHGVTVAAALLTSWSPVVPEHSYRAEMARILVTNDDGVDAEGLHHLAAAVLAAGHDVVVAAPSYDASGSGASIGNLRPDHQIPCTPVELPWPNLRHVPAWSVDGPPALCVLAAALGGFGERPDLVVSGVNPGLNTGRVVLYSGTVGACLSAQNLGIRGLAVSLQATDPWRFDTAAAVAVEVLPLLEGAPERTVLNLNVPGVDRSEVRGVRWCRLASFGEVRAASAEVAEGALQMRVTAVDEEIPADSDSGSVRDGWAALTTIVGVVEAWPTPAPPTGAVAETLVPGAPVHPVHRVVDAFGGDAVLLPRSE